MTPDLVLVRAFVKARPELADSLNRYSDDGIPTGGFLRAVLCGELYDAFARTDPCNAAAFALIVNYIVSCLPPESYGSDKRVDAWIAAHKERRGARSAAKT